MEEVIIPPVPYDKKQNKLEEGFLKAEDNELPAFEEHELGGIQTSIETKTSEKKTEHHGLPSDTVHKVLRATCIIALVVWFVLIVFLSIITNSDPFYTLVGLSPVLLTIIVTYILVDKYHLESGFLMIFPFVFTGILFMLGLAHLLEGIDYKLLSSVNIIFGLLFEAILTIHYSILRREKTVKKEEVKEGKVEEKFIVRLDDEGLKSFVSSIEDKAKAINAVIGRVYSTHHGGSDNLRKKIRIDAEHYNEINELKNQPHDKRRILAIELLRKIKDKLDMLNKSEKDVFDKSELKQLIHLARDADGAYKILDVLISNDKDPVKQYYDGAVEFCDNALDELVANELETMKARAAERKKRKIERAEKAIEEAKKKE
ncbi:hypothetical protein JW756_01270 [Candidatus Woesearchaeota archaeon]|nr:hypothetical protein [Candidatus Woesearchaeota archaeon]